MKEAVQPILRQSEKRVVRRRMAPRAIVVYEAIRREGEDELRRPSWALAWSGLAAGLSMGFSLVAEGLFVTNLPDTPWRQLISKFGYSVGFLIVVLGRQQLFTENTLTPVLPLLRKPSAIILTHVLRLWTVVFAANMIGTLLFAWMIGTTSIFRPEVLETFTQLGLESMEGDFVTTLLRAVFAGWLIALMVWLLPFAETARVTVIIIITYIIGLGGFSHIIAGSVEAFFAVVVGAAPLGDVLMKFTLPTLVGNVIGGVSLVAALNHAQVVAGAGKDEVDP